MDIHSDLEIHRLLKLGQAQDLLQDEHIDHALIGHLQPKLDPLEDNFIQSMDSIGAKGNSWTSYLIYPAIFLAAFVFFYVVLNFSSVMAQVSGVFIKPQSQQTLGNDSASYYKWMSNYFYAVGDASLLAPNNDIDHDGLTNYDEFIMQTNPIAADSSATGISDGLKVLNSMNLWGTGPMTAAQVKLRDKLNLIEINNNVTYYTGAASGKVAGASTIAFDQTKNGTLSVPKLKMQVPLVFSQDPSSFDADLTHGVIHYPGTAMPGEDGVIYVSGHSSDYIWKHDPMHAIFAQLNYLSAGDDIYLSATGKDGKLYNFHYQVSNSKVYKPDDQAQFFDAGNQSVLNLSTCWPIGTQTNRLVVSAVQKPI